MLTLSSMVWAAFLYINAIWSMHNVPMPVVIEVGETYKYNEMEDAIYVPSNWNDDCLGQRNIVFYMAKHFNNFSNGLNKRSEATLNKAALSWVCLTDDIIGKEVK